MLRYRLSFRSECASPSPSPLQVVKKSSLHHVGLSPTVHVHNPGPALCPAVNEGSTLHATDMNSRSGAYYWSIDITSIEVMQNVNIYASSWFIKSSIICCCWGRHPNITPISMSGDLNGALSKLNNRTILNQIPQVFHTTILYPLFPWSDSFCILWKSTVLLHRWIPIITILQYPQIVTCHILIHLPRIFFQQKIILLGQK